MCGAKGDSTSTSASSASFSTASDSGRSATGVPSFFGRRPGAPVAVCSSEKAYSSFTISISAETTVLRCTRGSRSCVTRRIVSWATRRTRCSASVRRSASSPPGAAPRQLVAPLVHQPPDARQEPGAPLEAGVRPLDFVLRGRHEHHVQAQGVGAVLADHVVGVDDVALRLRHRAAVLQHHALREQARERLVVLHHAEVAEHPAEEPRVDQVQDGVLDAAAVEIHRAPVLHLRRVERQLAVPRVAVAVEVPRRIDERVHRVGLAAGGAAAARARGVDELRHVRQRRVAAARELRDLGQHDRQLVVRHRHACRTCRSRRSGSACPSSAGARCPSPSAGTARCACRCPAPPPPSPSAEWRRWTTSPVKSPESTTRPGSTYASVIVSGVSGRRTLRLDDDRDRQAVLAGELEVALVVRGHRHHGAGAVLAEDEVRHPERHGLPGERVDRVATGEEPFLLDLARQPGGAVLRAEPLRLRPERLRARRTRRRTARPARARAPAGRRSRRKIVSMRVVKTSMSSSAFGTTGRLAAPPGSNAAGISGKPTRAPSDRPIQFRCIVRTFSGQSARRSVASSSSCA